MKNNSSISLKTDNLSVETEGGRKATGVSTDSATQSSHFPDPKVTEKAVCRKFTATYKLCILQEAEACTTQGQIGAFLRREGLYSSNLTANGRRQQKKGALEALFPKHRGLKAKNIDPSDGTLETGRCPLWTYGPNYERTESALKTAFENHPKRFKEISPKPPSTPVAAWINQPKQISTLHLESKLFKKVSNSH
ncbi:MAG: hypothetical protein HRF42_07005 [Candidatus Brocadia sp.]|jgi:hypothetical protein